MVKQKINIIFLCLIVFGNFGCFNLDANNYIGGKDVKLISKEELFEYIETVDNSVSIADFDDVDVEDFIEQNKLSLDKLEDRSLMFYLSYYELKRDYPDYPLLSKEELIEFITENDVGVEYDDFADIDIEDFIKTYSFTPYEVRVNSVKYRLIDYRRKMEYRNAENYNYLFTTEYETLKKEDISNIVRLYCNAWIGSNDFGRFGHWNVSFFDFEKNIHLHPAAESIINPTEVYMTGIYIMDDPNILPEGAFEHICKLLTENNIVKMKQTKFPEIAKVEGTWNLCIELIDGRIIRYSGYKPPKQFSGFARGIYNYEITNFKKNKSSDSLQ